MKKLTKQIFLALALLAFYSCNETVEKTEQSNKTKDSDFEYVLDRFADLQILRYRVPGFETLDLQKKKLAYFLYQAALSGRDIIFDQNYKHNLRIRKTLEAIFNSYSGDKIGAEWQRFEVYAKRVWFSGGVHHHYATTKIIPEFDEAYFAQLVSNSDEALLPLAEIGRAHV